jgi:hypothetical protein
MQVGSSSFDDITAPGAPFYYDTAKFNVAGYTPNGLKAIQITLRVWDNKTRLTRQVTIAQDHVAGMGQQDPANTPGDDRPGSMIDGRLSRSERRQWFFRTGRELRPRSLRC